MSAIFKQNHAKQCEAWTTLGAVNRAAYIRDASGKLADLTAHPQKAYQLFNHLILQTPRLDDVHHLEGVTGEVNELYLTARGKVMVVGTANATPIAVLGQLLAALLTGNEVILHYPTQADICEQALSLLRNTGMLPEVMEVANDAQLETLLHINRLAVVAAVGTFEELAAMGHILANTDGVLTQIVGVTDAAGCSDMFAPDYIERFMTERVKTVNTTAIGGNATLIELGQG